MKSLWWLKDRRPLVADVEWIAISHIYPDELRFLLASGIRVTTEECPGKDGGEVVIIGSLVYTYPNANLLKEMFPDEEAT